MCFVNWLGVVTSSVKAHVCMHVPVRQTPVSEILQHSVPVFQTGCPECLEGTTENKTHLTHYDPSTHAFNNTMYTLYNCTLPYIAGNFQKVKIASFRFLFLKISSSYLTYVQHGNI